MQASTSRVSGIVGFVLARPNGRPDRRVLDRMAQRIADGAQDVGNDGNDVGVVVRGPAALGVCRPSAREFTDEPASLSGEDAAVSVAVHGELYNARDLARRLVSAGNPVKSPSHVETVVHAWKARGADALHDLEGVFALAVWNDLTRTLVLARDRLGVKSLYYAVLPDGLVFASELTALLEHPALARELDMEAVSTYLSHGWVAAPRSMVKGVQKLSPGHRLVYADGQARVERWWEAGYDEADAVVDVQAAARLGAVLDLAVRQHVLGDVPPGVLLSGDLDSSVVAMFARRHVNRLQTFAIAFDDASRTEAMHARRVAAVLDAEHNEDVVAGGATLDLVAALGDIVDEPAAAPEILKTYLLARVARGAVVVALSGAGGDELFAGHPSYRAHTLARAWPRCPRSLRRLARAALARLPGAHAVLGDDFAVERFMADADLDLDMRHAVWTGCFTPETQRALLAPGALARLGTAPSYAEWRRLAASAPAAPWLHRVIDLDVRGALAEATLPMLGRAATACSLRLRVPLLDRRVVEVTSRLPAEMKLRGFTTKHVLKWLVRHRLPADVMRASKSARGVPLARWLRGELRPLVHEVLADDALRRDGVFDAGVVSRLVGQHVSGQADHAQKLYALLVLSLWTRRHRVR